MGCCRCCCPPTRHDGVTPRGMAREGGITFLRCVALRCAAGVVSSSFRAAAPARSPGGTKRCPRPVCRPPLLAFTSARTKGNRQRAVYKHRAASCYSHALSVLLSAQLAHCAHWLRILRTTWLFPALCECEALRAGSGLARPATRRARARPRYPPARRAARHGPHISSAVPSAVPSRADGPRHLPGPLIPCEPPGAEGPGNARHTAHSSRSPGPRSRGGLATSYRRFPTHPGP